MHHLISCVLFVILLFFINTVFFSYVFQTGKINKWCIRHLGEQTTSVRPQRYVSRIIMTRLPPSSIHFMDASKEPGLLSPSTYEVDVIEAFSTKSDNLKVQVVEKGGLLYTLNNSTLDLCRTLEERGYLAKVKVDIIRCSDVPTPLLSLMNPPTGETLLSKR